MLRFACLLTAGLFVLASALLVTRPPPEPDPLATYEAYMPGGIPPIAPMTCWAYWDMDPHRYCTLDVPEGPLSRVYMAIRLDGRVESLTLLFRSDAPSVGALALRQGERPVIRRQWGTAYAMWAGMRARLRLNGFASLRSQVLSISLFERSFQ